MLARRGVVMKALADVFDAVTVARLAGPRVHPRGVWYLSDRRVEPAEVRDGRLEARVRGTVPYSVELWTDRGRPRWSCTCPAAEDGSFCKHAVALALSLGPGDAPRLVAPLGTEGRSLGSAVGGSGSSAADEFVAYVEGLSADRLVEIVLECAGSDWRLRELLLAEARASRGADPDLSEWRRRIDRAFAPSEYSRGGVVTYSEAAGWAAGIDDVIDALDSLCDVGHHDAAARLAEHAHRCADRSMDYVDDSDGCLTNISERLSELHLRACEASPPDPAELAARLVDLELGSELGGFYRCAAVYAETLGEVGLAAFRARLDQRRSIGEPDEEDGMLPDYAERGAMVGWALGTGDPDALIEVHGREDVPASAVLEIARALDRADRGAEAMQWARKGVSQWNGRGWQVDELRDFLARKLRDQGDAHAAVELFWQSFVARPELSGYRRLQQEGAGADWLTRCEDHLRRCLARTRGAASAAPATPEAAFAAFPSAVPQAAVALVNILLYEGCIDAAWDVARGCGVPSDLWLTLARAREQGHPLDAIAVYEVAALAIIGRKVAKHYESAVDLMVRIRRLALSAGEPERFAALLERVRTEHRAKRKLKSLLDAEGW